MFLKSVYLVAVIFLLAGCNPFYVIQAAYVESDILLRRQPINKLLDNPNIPPSTREKLLLVSAAREFSLREDFEAGGSFKYYTDIEGPVSWLLTAVKKDAFVPYTWWFPFVGRVPYKGFFSLEAAKEAGKDLEKEGYEVSIRPVEAFSTLGWFDDPILTPLLARSPNALVETVFHEIVHSTVWFPGDVAFNESFAQFVALHQSLKFFSDEQYNETLLKEAQTREKEFTIFAGLISKAYEELEQLYNSDISSEEKLVLREPIYTSLIHALKEQTPGYRFIDEANNADLMSVRIYTQGFPTLERLYQATAQNLPAMVQFVESIESCRENGESSSLFSLVENALNVQNTDNSLLANCLVSRGVTPHR